MALLLFWTTETLAVPKSTFFLDELAYRRQVSKNEGTYMGGIEIVQLPYTAPKGSVAHSTRTTENVIKEKRQCSFL